MTQRDWQKDMDVVQALKGNKVADAMCYWLQEAKRLEGIATGRGQAIIRKNAEIVELEARADASERREQRLKEEIEKVVKDILPWGDAETAIEKAINHFKYLSSTPLYPDTTAPKEGDKQ